MNTKIVKINPENIDEEKMSQMGKIISDGGLVSFPTETVYGLGANAFSSAAVANIFKAKGRPSDNPLIVHISSADKIPDVAREVPEAAKKVFDAFSPGPITVILKKSPFIPDGVTAGLDTVAVRIPSHPIARELIKKSGVPIAAPSSNRSGKPSPTKAEHVIFDMDGRIDAIIDGGECSVGVESTIIDMSGEKPVILRPGGITYAQLKKILPNVEIDRHILKSIEKNEAPKCPGMKYKHYAPDAEVYVIEGEKGRTEEKIRQCIKENSDKRVGVISIGDADYDAQFVLRVDNSNVDYANKLFDYLREFDKQKIDIVFAEFSIEDDYALAVKNRLYKSAANRIIRV